MNMDAEKYYEARFVFDKGRTKVWKAINEYLQSFIPENASVMDAVIQILLMELKRSKNLQLISIKTWNNMLPINQLLFQHNQC